MIKFDSSRMALVLSQNPNLKANFGLALKRFIFSLLKSFITLFCLCSGTRDSLMSITTTCDMHVTMRCIKHVDTNEKRSVCCRYRRVIDAYPYEQPQQHYKMTLHKAKSYFSTSNFRRNVNIMLGNKGSGSSTFKTASASASCFHKNLKIISASCFRQFSAANRFRFLLPHLYHKYKKHRNFV